MTLLERLKELNATTGKRNGDEDLGYWADREKRENMWVRDVALPALLEVAEAAGECREADKTLYLTGAIADVVKKEQRLDAALAKLEVEA